MNTIFEKYALGAILSDSNGHRYDFIMENFELGEIPNGVVVYAPFEDLQPEELANLIEEERDIFRAFAQELDERRASGIE